MADVVNLRRVPGGPRRVGSGLRRVPIYEVLFSDGGSRRVDLYQLDLLLDARAWLASFWVCVDAADLAFSDGDRDVLIEWPTGRRSDHV